MAHVEQRGLRFGGGAEFVLLVVVDGVRLTSFRDLDRIPASTILSITVYTGIDGTTYYGTNASSGVVLIETKHGTDS